MRPVPAVRRVHLPRGGQERFAQHRACAGGRDREPQRLARDPRGADCQRHPPISGARLVTVARWTLSVRPTCTARA
jgi:hypothetical protein